MIGFPVRVQLGVWDIPLPVFLSPSPLHPVPAAPEEASQIADNLSCVFSCQLSVRGTRLPKGNRLIEKLIAELIDE